MKKQQKKAFTLVELLVVIAILAILSTVAVVGYTSFIKKSAVSNDENLAEQLNRYLDALKADSTGEFYNATIDETNFAALIDEITTNGLGGDIEASAAKYGVHIYFNKGLQKFEALEEDAVLKTAEYTPIIPANAANGEPESYSPYNCFTKDGNYFLADTVGEWANIIKAYNSIVDKKTLETAYSLAQEMSIGTTSVPGLALLIETTVFVTNNVNLVVSNGVEHNNIVVNSDVEVISGSKTPLTGDSVTIAEGTALFAPKDNDVVITIPSSITYVAPNLANIATGTTVTIQFEKESAEEIASVVESGSKFGEGVTVKNSNGDVVTIEGNNVVVNGEKAPIGVKNTVTGLKFDLTGGEVVNEEYIIWGSDYTFKTEIVSKTYNDQPLVSEAVVFGVTAKSEKGADYSNFVKIDDNGKLTFLSENGEAPEIDSITVTATAAAGDYKQSITYKVLRVESCSLTIAEKVVDTGSKLTLVKYSNVDTYPVAVANVVFNHNNKISCDYNVTWSYDGKGTSSTGTNEIKLNDEVGSGSLTVSVGCGNATHIKFDNITLSIANENAFAFVPVNGNYTVLGNGTEIRLADLFKLREGAELPEGAMLEVYNNTQFDDDTYMTPHRAYVETTGEGFKVSANKVAITGTNFNDFSVTFTGTSDGDIVRFAIVQNGVRISNDVEVQIIDAVNVRDYSEFALTGDKNTFTENIVLLSDVTIASKGFLTIPKNYTLYGNGYTFDVTQGRNSDGIITLAGTIRDVKIIGEVYPDFAFSRDDTYGSSAVVASGNAKIINSYISNTRAPLMVNSGNVIIENSVLFGGRYANVDAVGGTLTVRGTVTTVQQLVEAADGTKVIGLGISAWFNDGKKNVVVEDGANLLQYNFVANTDDMKGNLPPLSLIGYEIMDLTAPFDHIFSNTAEYGKYVFEVNGVQYANSGMIATDKYMLNYEVTGTELKWYQSKYKEGDYKIVTVKTDVSDEEEFLISYDTRFDCPQNVVKVADGLVRVTGAQLKEGVKFTLNAEISWSTISLDPNGDPTKYMFQIQSDNYRTLDVSAYGYDSITYTFDKELAGKMGLVESAVSMHSKGLHYGKMCVDVYTVENTNTTYQQLLENYINMGKFYYPENYQFDGGNITNYQGK